MLKVLTGLLFCALLTLQTAYASDWTAAVPPPNDVGLMAKEKTLMVVHHYHRHKKHRHYHHRPLAKRYHHYYHRKTTCYRKVRGPQGIYVYYALPATACCGSMKTVTKYRCCAHSGAWPASNYSTFKAGPEDFIYSATNDDEYRNQNDDWKLIGNDERESTE